MPTARKLHLVCNAHLDPVWLWEWEEGAAEAVSTFRAAADLCEQFPGFVFNHNEAVLYKWVEEYEPALFRRIRRLVREGKWNIIGGWWVQPDCNMPGGESFIRQGLAGRAYFREKFGVEPTTAVNFDPFGHTRGLVQILAGSGYDSYLVCRPDQQSCRLESNEFVWVGFDGSEVLVKRCGGYNSQLGRAHEKIRRWLAGNPLPWSRPGVELWGVGNHGGGPSRVDLARINTLAAGRKDIAIVHSTPQAYFRELARIRQKLPRHTADLNPWAVGCYISQVRVKQRHRRLENELYACEKMASAAAFQGLMEYPAAELRAALEDLLLAEFHDVLPGSSIQPAEEAALRMMDHGLEIASRVKARAFFAMARGQKAAAKDTLPILVYNPHPHRVRAIVECELQPSDINFQRTTWRAPQILRNGRRLPCQCEKEASNVPLDWRKRVVFLADLEPGRMNRFDCRMEMQPAKPAAAPRIAGGSFRFKTRDLDVTVNARTGLLDRYRARGADLLRPGAFRPIVMEDSEDSWAMTVRGFRKVAGRFALASAADGAAWSGLRAPLPSVRIVEDGEVRTVVETVFRHGHSFICQRYKLPKAGTEVEVETRVHWAEKDRLLKLSLPTTLAGGEFLGQVACGVQRLPDNGDEAVAQKWVGVIGRRRGLALTVANDGTYAADFAGGELRLSLLRSAAYSAHPWSDWAAPGKILRRDRFTPRMEQGERVFRFWLNGGRLAGRMENVDREALVHNEKPMALSFFPPGDGPAPKPFVEIRGAAVQLMAAKRAERGRDLVLRLFEPTGRSRRVTLRLPFAGLRTGVALGPFEIRTLRINPRKRAIREVSLAETEKPRRSRQPAQ